MRIVVLGRPGAGKGTQVQRLAARLGLATVAASTELARLASTDSPTGHRVREAMNTGALVPDDLVVTAVGEALRRTTGSVVLDGFPRNITQCEALRRVLDPDGVDVAVELVVPPNEVLRRVRQRRVCPNCATPVDTSCDRCDLPGIRRADDDPEVVLRRLWVYQRDTRPVAEWFERRGLLVRVNGMGEVDDVHRRLVAAVGGGASTAAPVADLQPAGA